jgi:hypothetical protein
LDADGKHSLLMSMLHVTTSLASRWVAFLALYATWVRRYVQNRNASMIFSLNFLFCYWDNIFFLLWYVGNMDWDVRRHNCSDYSLIMGYNSDKLGKRGRLRT